MEERPRLKLELSTLDKALEIAGWLIFASLWLLTIVSWKLLPEIIPDHFNASGHPDHYGSKAIMLSMPVLASILFIGMSVLNKYPHVFNYPVGITSENASFQYKNSTRMVRFLKVAILIFFFYLAAMTYRTATSLSGGLGWWFLPLTVAIVLIPLFYFIRTAFSHKN